MVDWEKCSKLFTNLMAMVGGTYACYQFIKDQLAGLHILKGQSGGCIDSKAQKYNFWAEYYLVNRNKKTIYIIKILSAIRVKNETGKMFCSETPPFISLFDNKDRTKNLQLPMALPTDVPASLFFAAEIDMESPAAKAIFEDRDPCGIDSCDLIFIDTSGHEWIYSSRETNEKLLCRSLNPILRHFRTIIKYYSRSIFEFYYKFSKIIKK